MKKTLIGLGVAWVVLVAAVTSNLANADTPTSQVCMRNIEMIESLDIQFGERQLVTAAENRQVNVQIYVSEAGSWTMVGNTQAGDDAQTCVMASGFHWQMIDK